MARGKRTRSFRRFKPVTPDRGWFVTKVATSISVASDSPYMFPAEILQFDDIDNDPAAIRQNKSDWFVQRIIYDGYIQYRTDVLSSFPYCWVEQALLVLQNDAATNLESIGVSPLGADVYNDAARIIHTEARFLGRPTSHTMDANGRLNVQTGGATINNRGINGINDIVMGCEQHFDIKVKFGLRDQTSFYQATGWPGTSNPFYRPEIDGDIDLYGTWRFLVQKRRTG